jgi:hypothetical protein
MSLLWLDTLNIWDSDIWLLYKDICGQDLPTMLAVIRAWQMGKITEADIHSAL